MAEVRRAGVDDWEAIRDVRLRALADAPTAFGSTYAREVAFDDAEWRRRAGNGACFLAEDGGRTVGIVLGLATEKGHELLAMWVDPGARRSGAGAALVRAVRDWAVAEGAPEVLLGVTEGNDAARRLYVREGFAPTGYREPLLSDTRLFIEQMRRPLP